VTFFVQLLVKPSFRRRPEPKFVGQLMALTSDKHLDPGLRRDDVGYEGDELTLPDVGRVADQNRIIRRPTTAPAVNLGLLK